MKLCPDDYCYCDKCGERFIWLEETEVVDVTPNNGLKLKFATMCYPCAEETKAERKAEELETLKQTEL